MIAQKPKFSLEEIHHFLSEQDQEYRLFWSNLASERQETLRSLWAVLGTIDAEPLARRAVRHAFAENLTRRYFVHVQEREFEYGRIRPDWYTFIQTDEYLMELYQDSSRRLALFLERSDQGLSAIIYGGQKPKTSIYEKLERNLQSVRDKRIRPEVVDIWDVVRFRIVVPDLESLRALAMEFWELFFDDVMRCRNYYYRPRQAGEIDPYRAIHFEIVDQAGRIVEIQMTTAAREAISLMDHPLIFKRRHTEIDTNLLDQLLGCSMSANILDAQRLLDSWRENTGA